MRFAVAFDASSQHPHVESAPPPSLEGLERATFEGWFRVHAAPDYGVFFVLPNLTYCQFTGPIYGGNQNRPVCLARPLISPTIMPNDQCFALNTQELDRWFHLAWVFDQGTFTMYVDGVIQGAAEALYGALATDTVLRFGYGVSHPDEGLDGAVDEFRISSAARYSSNFTPPPHLEQDASTIYLLLFDEGAGATAENQVAGAPDGTLMNGATWVLSDR